MKLKPLLQAQLRSPGMRVAAMGLFGILTLAALSNLAIGVTFGFNFDQIPGSVGGGGIPEGFVPPPGDYSELIENYDGAPPPGYGSGSGSTSPPGGSGGSGGEPPPSGGGGEPPPGGGSGGGGSGGGSGSGGGEPPPGGGSGGSGGGEIPNGAAEGIRPGSGDNSVPDGFQAPDSSGFDFSGFGDALSNPMDPKSVLIFLAVLAGAAGAFIGLRYLRQWLAQRDQPARATDEQGRRLKPRPLPKDPRQAILVAYETFVVEGRRRGVDIHEHETPREYSRRVAGAGHTRPETSLRLTDLYEEARLSTHPIGAKQRDEAVDLMKRLTTELNRSLSA